MAALTATDIQTRVMNALRMPTSNTTEATKVMALINQIYRDVASKQDWSFLIKRSVINTTAKLQAGETNVLSVTAPTSVSVTINSATVTFSSSIVQDIAGFMFIVPGAVSDSLAVYRIASHGGNNASETLDAAYTDSTNTAADFRLYQDSYSLPTDVLKVLNVKRYGEFSPLLRSGIEEMSQIKLSDQTEGKPEMYSVFDYATTGDPTTAKLLQIHPYPDKLYRMEIFYKQQLNTELSGTTRAYVPDEFAEILIYGTLARGFPQFLNDLERGKYYQQLFNDTLALMSAQQKEYTRDNPGVRPTNDYRKAQGRPRSSFTFGSWFDRLPNQL